jgi:hypothetical protein
MDDGNQKDVEDRFQLCSGDLPKMPVNIDTLSEFMRSKTFTFRDLDVEVDHFWICAFSCCPINTSLRIEYHPDI